MTLEDFFSRFDPEKPAGAYYVDCTAVRGNDLIGKKIFMAFAGSPGEYRHKIFTGHIGGGKSSELKKICEFLKVKQFGRTFFPVFVDMDDYMDNRDVDIRDIFLAIVAEVGTAFREQLGIELRDSYFAKRFAELKNALLSDVEVNKSEVTIGNLKSSFVLNRRSGEFREMVREKLFRVAESLVEEVNLLLVQARTKLAEKGDYDDFVLIIDGLDKIEKLRDGRESNSDIAEFFLSNANQLKSIKAHTIWTAPLKVVRSCGPEMAQRYDGQPIVLPMIRTRLRNGQSCQEGIEKAKEIIITRLNGYKIEEDALAEMVRYSGGHTRMLVQLVRYAAEYSGFAFPLEKRHALLAINSIAKTFVGAVHDEDWKVLVELEDSATKTWDISKDENTRLLEQLCVLEYVNGEGEEIGQSIQWYGVHPIVQELPRYKEAKKAASAISS